MARKVTIAQGTVQEENAGLEAAAYAKEVLGISNRKLQKAVRTKGLLVNGRQVHSKSKLRTGDQVSILLPLAEQVKIQVADPAKLKILYEDPWLLGVEKRAGLPTYALQGDKGLANQVVGYYLAQGLKITPRPLHRLDTPTSGVVVFAKDAETQTLMNKAWELGMVRRFYYALCAGQFAETREINVSLGKEAVTRVNPIQVHQSFTELEVELITGRTHQIRRHLAMLGHPLLGDKRYGEKQKKNSRLALHATCVSFTHPRNQEQELEIHSPIPYEALTVYFESN